METWIINNKAYENGLGVPRYRNDVPIAVPSHIKTVFAEHRVVGELSIHRNGTE